tara:strand:+ start:6671 stop:7828 length:1158 start_codon:yes stop_codon:yes gene_type:complete
MDIKINKNDIETFILNYEGERNFDNICNELHNIYVSITDVDEYVIKEIVTYTIHKMNEKERLIRKRKEQLKQLKKLTLPEQRSKEWYEMRKDKLTASSLASAIGHCHFQSRDELILSKIEEKPFEPNPITEWGVKYEDIAIMFYEELYHVKVLDFGLIPHPTFGAFGASPDGICDDTGNDEYVARMVEIKCPPKRKFTKTVPPHYGMQVQGQLEVCGLDECDFFQVKIEEYDNYEEYTKDNFENDDIIQNGRTSLNYPKGVTLSYKKNGEDKLTYLYPKLNLSNEEYQTWIQENKTTVENEGHKFVEAKWWFISRYECTLVKKDHSWWIESIDKILSFYKDLLHYRNDLNALQTLKDRIIESKKRKKKVEIQPMNDFQLISEDED